MYLLPKGLLYGAGGGGGYVMGLGTHAVSRESLVPLYHQVTESLRERIESREWEPGTKIPTEKDRKSVV